METYYGKSVSQGMAMGKVLFFHERKEFFSEESTDDVEKELELLKAGVKAVGDDLKGISKNLKHAGREQEGTLVDSHRLLLTDSYFLEACVKKYGKKKQQHAARYMKREQRLHFNLKTWQMILCGSGRRIFVM